MADISPARSDAGAPVIVARGVHKHYGPIHAVDGVDLEVRSGELFGLIGHNGAGKSTMFKMMLGLIPLTAGEIRIDGAPVPGSDFRAVRRKVAGRQFNDVVRQRVGGSFLHGSVAGHARRKLRPASANGRTSGCGR